MALALGKTVREMLDTMSSNELTEWQAFFKIEPWGEDRADWRSAQIAALIYTANKGKRSPKREVRDFMWSHINNKDERGVSDPDAMKALLMGMVEVSKRRKP